MMKEFIPKEQIDNSKKPIMTNVEWERLRRQKKLEKEPGIPDWYNLIVKAKWDNRTPYDFLPWYIRKEDAIRSNFEPVLHRGIEEIGDKERVQIHIIAEDIIYKYDPTKVVKRFGKFNKIDLRNRFIGWELDRISQEEPFRFHLYEVLLEKSPKKFYFDIDITTDKVKPELLDEYANLSIVVLIRTMEKLYSTLIDKRVTGYSEDNKWDINKDIIIFSSHGTTKRSFHIIFPHIVFSDPSLGRYIYDYIVDEMYEDEITEANIYFDPDELFDSCVYKADQLFRLPYSSKYEDSKQYKDLRILKPAYGPFIVKFKEQTITYELKKGIEKPEEDKFIDLAFKDDKELFQKEIKRLNRYYHQFIEEYFICTTHVNISSEFLANYNKRQEEILMKSNIIFKSDGLNYDLSLIPLPKGMELSHDAETSTNGFYKLNRTSQSLCPICINLDPSHKSKGGHENDSQAFTCNNGIIYLYCYRAPAYAKNGERKTIPWYNYNEDKLLCPKEYYSLVREYVEREPINLERQIFIMQKLTEIQNIEKKRS